MKNRKKPSHVKYHSDGTGRDSYVVHDAGGLRINHKSLNEFHFKDFLRYKKWINKIKA